MKKCTLFQSKLGQRCWLLFFVLTITSFSAFSLPVFINCSDTSFVAHGDTLNPMADQCMGEAQLRPLLSSDCEPVSALRIDYKIDWYDDGQFDELGYSDNQGGSYPFANPDSLPVRTFSAGLPEADGSYPVGTHRIVWTVRDSCGEMDSCGYRFEMIDGVVPTPYCQIGINYVPLDFNAVAWRVKAADFDLASTDNCTSSDQLRFSFSTDPMDTLREYPLNAAFECSYLDTIYVWDEADNYSTCVVGYILRFCGKNYPQIRGYVLTEDGQSLSDTEVILRDNENTDTLSQSLTSDRGYFYFDNIPPYRSYSIAPLKNNEPANGLTTFDLILLSRHILGIKPLTSPYKMIAADVNNSRTITTFDMVEMRKLILRIDTAFQGVPSWKFIPADYEFPDSLNPFVEFYPETWVIPEFDREMRQDFVALKMGDINGSATLELTNQSTRQTTASPLPIITEDQWLCANEETTVILYTHYLEQALGFQLALKFPTDVISIREVTPGMLPAMTAENLGISQMDEGLLLLSWHQAEAQSFRQAPLLKLKIRSQQDIRLSEVLQLQNSALTSEVYVEKSPSNYPGSIQSRPLQLQFRNAASFAHCQDTSFLAFGHPSDSTADQCVGQIELRPGISSDCTQAAGLQIDYRIDLNDDGQDDLLGYSDNQGSSYPYPNPDSLPVVAFDAGLPQADGIYPVGTHRIVWTVRDSCGMESSCDHHIELIDGVPPAPFCIPGISTIPIGGVCSPAGGYVDIFAFDFNLGSSDNCTAAEALRYSFSPDINDTKRRLTCADGGVVIFYTIHIWDEAGNLATCPVSILVNDCSNNRSRDACFFGEIYTETGEAIRSVSVQLMGHNINDYAYTDRNGEFNFELYFAGEYQISMDKVDDPLNGVSTFDLLQISRHILGITPLDSPYKLIAADINASQTVTTFDMVEMRKVILGVRPGFPGDVSWRFINAAYPLDAMQVPPLTAFVDPEVFNFDNEPLYEEYIGIKLGDVTGNADPSALLTEESDPRSVPQFFQLPDQQMRAGKTYDIPVYADGKHLYGFQLALQGEGLEIVGVRPGVLPGMGAEQYQLDERGLRMSWHKAEGVQPDKREALFYLQLRSKRTQMLSQILHLSAMLASETYVAEANSIVPKMLELHFDAEGLSSAQRIFPNPADDEVYILGEAEGPFDVFIRSMDGRIHLSQQEVYSRKTPILISNLPSGAYILTIFNLDKAKQTIKLIKI